MDRWLGWRFDIQAVLESFGFKRGLRAVCLWMEVILLARGLPYTNRLTRPGAVGVYKPAVREQPCEWLGLRIDRHERSFSSGNLI